MLSHLLILAWPVIPVCQVYHDWNQPQPSLVPGHLHQEERTTAWGEKINFIVVHVIGYYSRLLYLWSLMLRRKRRRRRMKGQIEGVAKSNFSTSQETNHPWILIILTYCRTRGVASVTPIERWCSRDSWSPTLLASSGSTVRDSALADAGRTIRPSPRVLEVSWQPPRCSSRDNTPLQQTRTRRT